MTQTWNLTLTPADGPETTTTGLTREQTMRALNDLMYGTFAPADRRLAEAERDGERYEPLAA